MLRRSCWRPEWVRRAGSKEAASANDVSGSLGSDFTRLPEAFVVCKLRSFAAKSAQGDNDFLIAN